MQVIGITGGIGCGKSAVLNMLPDLCKCMVIEADKVAHEVMKKGQIAYEAIVKEFSTDILGKEKEIDRKILGSIVFSNEEKLAMLNSIVHPMVKTRIKEIIEEKKKEGLLDFIFIEAALLLEDHYEEICNEIWYIYAPFDSRKQRLIKARGLSEEKILSIIKEQRSEEQFRRDCDKVVDNGGSIEDTRKEIVKLLENIEHQ